MKILIIVDTYYPLQDGVQNVTQYLAEGLSKNNEILVITSLRSGTKRLEVYNGVEIERVIAKRNMFTMKIYGEKRKVKRIINNFLPDVIIVTCVQTWGFDWLKKNLSKYPGKKVLYTHGCSCLEIYDVREKIREFRFRRQIVADLMSIYKEWYWGKYRKGLAEDINRFDKVIYLYEKDKLYLEMSPILKNKSVIIENAVDEVFFERNAYRVNDSKTLTFINISSYVENKNQKLILEAYYDANIPNSKLVLIGSQETIYYQEMLELNDNLNKQYSDFYGNVEIYCGISRKRTLEIYQEADVYVSASKIEMMSVSLCEAAAAGLTILATDVGHVSSIPGVFLCNTKQEFVEKMQLIYREPNIRIERGRLAYEYALKHYQIYQKVNELERELITLVNGD